VDEKLMDSFFQIILPLMYVSERNNGKPNECPRGKNGGGLEGKKVPWQQ
jgi:hypothetical protein